MAGGKQCNLHSADILFLTEWQKNFPAFPGQPRLHQTRRPFRNNNLAVRRDVIAMRVRNEREILGLPRVEPEILLRQEHAAFISDIDHAEIYPRISAGKLAFGYCPDLNARIGTQTF